uniref:Uncharacterized protein n=1 Tax=Ditylum brightwellii TaxID=49249 RepID=A0A7S4QL76_9STRA
MTAIKGGAAGSQRSADLPPSMEAQHARHFISQPKPNRTSNRESLASVAAAKERFVAATVAAMEKLMACGCGRERAAMLLLREMGKNSSPPTDQEVFRIMKSMGLGMEEASRVATVSRAVQKARGEQGLSAVDAIDDLTSRLNSSQLFGTEPMTSPPRTSLSSPRERPCAPLPNRVTPKKTVKSGKTKPPLRTRKRHLESPTASATKSSRPPDNQIDATLVKHKLAKKNTDDTPLTSLAMAKPAPAVVSVRNPNLKRSVDDTRAQSPPMKRTRSTPTI